MRISRRALGVILVAAGLLLTLAGALMYETGNSRGAIAGGPVTCNAEWAHRELRILSGDGDIYIVRGNGSGAQVWVTHAFYLIARGFLDENATVEDVRSVLENDTIVSTIVRAGSPYVAQVNVSTSKGFRILAPEGPDCGCRAAENLYPGKDVECRYVGLTVFPARLPDWPYNNVSLPTWEIYSDGRRLGALWVDPDKGLVVGEVSGDMIIVRAEVIVER